MSTAEERRRMAAASVNFEARRDSKGQLMVYKLPPGDGGGRYEVAGINERYNKQTCDVLVSLVKAGRFDEAEALATDFIAEDTDRAAAWTSIPAIECYLRDSVFNRGAGGGARILQRALGVHDDGAVGQQTRAAEAAAESDPAGLLRRLRTAREQYERDVVHRNEKSKFWKGLVNRWNNALDIAKTFPMTSTRGAPAPVAQPVLLPSVEEASIVPAGPTEVTGAILAALRVGMSGPRVTAWQTFLRGQGFDVGAVDGSFGEHTRDATKAFQKKANLDADGVAGRQTLLRAASLGLELIEEPADDNTSSNFPPKPNFPPLVTNAQRAAESSGDGRQPTSSTCQFPSCERLSEPRLPRRSRFIVWRQSSCRVCGRLGNRRAF